MGAFGSLLDLDQPIPAAEEDGAAEMMQTDSRTTGGAAGSEVQGCLPAANNAAAPPGGESCETAAAGAAAASAAAERAAALGLPGGVAGVDDGYPGSVLSARPRRLVWPEPGCVEQGPIGGWTNLWQAVADTPNILFAARTHTSSRAA